MALMRNGEPSSSSPNTVTDTAPKSKRFRDMPSVLEVIVANSNEAVEIDLEGLPDDPTEICTLLENEAAPKAYWLTIAMAYAKVQQIDQAVDVVTRALVVSQEPTKEKMSYHSCLCALNLLRARGASRLIPDGTLVSEARTKDFYLKAATSGVNEALRFNASAWSLHLTRGVLYLMRASLLPPAQAKKTPHDEQSERAKMLLQAQKSFEDVHRTSKVKNVWALMGKSKAQYSLGKYSDALVGFQEVLYQRPDIHDPDPRIGVGCCMWQLGLKRDAKQAWERAIEVNPDSSVGHALLGLYYLETTSGLLETDPAFLSAYKKAMIECTQRAFKLKKDLPLACVTFARFFLARGSLSTVESLARKAIEFTDVNAVASDGWYLLAQKEHQSYSLAKAGEYYKKADEARGGLDKGFMPAKLGAAQVLAQTGDMDGAKSRLEKVLQQPKCVEAQTLLGTILAEEVVASDTGSFKDDKPQQRKRAIQLLEAVRQAWQDPERRLNGDRTVALNLARLHEHESIETSRQCLKEVEQMELKFIRKTPTSQEANGEGAAANNHRDRLPPQLLNNLGCCAYTAEEYEEATLEFQTALNACADASYRHSSVDTDKLVPAISYNLARAYEADGKLDEAKKVYEGLVGRKGGHTDAHARLAYIALRQSPTDEGPKAVSKLVQSESGNLEVRALYGWFLSRSRKQRSTNLAEDPEQRHYKHTLQHYDKHDRYSLTGMGNLYLTNAREMRRESEADRDKRRKSYEKAVEFFDKALQLDPQNAYAAQGIAIALIEDRRDYGTAIQILVKVHDVVRDSNVAVNLGHAYVDVKQYTRAVEVYQEALAKDRGRDAQLLACLGRATLLKGKSEKNLTAMKLSLEYSQRALDLAGHQIHFKFNVAFVQIQIAQLIHMLSETQRSLVDVQAAAKGLDEAIESLSEIAQSPNPPYPKNEIEQRANMGRNTMRRQLERAVQAQREYEEKHEGKLRRAREQREADLRRRDEERKKAEALGMERKKRIAEERREILERDRLLGASRVEEQNRRELIVEDLTTDAETATPVKKKRGGGRKKKGGGDGIGLDDAPVPEKKKKRKLTRKKDDSTNEAATSDDENEGDAPKKRRRLQRKTAASAKNKFKSSELVVDSDEDLDEVTVRKNVLSTDNDDDDYGGRATSQSQPQPTATLTVGDLFGDATTDDGDDDEEDQIATRPVRSRRKKNARVIDDDDDDDDDEGVVVNKKGDAVASSGVSEPVAADAKDKDKDMDKDEPTAVDGDKDVDMKDVDTSAGSG